MALTFVGLGLADHRDITVKGLEAVRAADVVYLEHYTATLADPPEKLAEFYGKPVTPLTREAVEDDAAAQTQIIDKAKTQRVALLVVGDPLCATTHTDLYLRAKREGVPRVSVIHNASIMSALGECGLQLYRFGEVVSIPFFDGEWRPRSFYEKIVANRTRNLHTLCLLDIKVREQTVENMMKGNDKFEPPR
eukprot:GHVU01173116.1.p2 GENE.GHVU01173116.1~~GHVU01173116.1.p2  ORF type:complete len:192 (-),score=49.57 GHVU01173116.1:221-796(-)